MAEATSKIPDNSLSRNARFSDIYKFICDYRKAKADNPDYSDDKVVEAINNSGANLKGKGKSKIKAMLKKTRSLNVLECSPEEFKEEVEKFRADIEKKKNAQKPKRDEAKEAYEQNAAKVKYLKSERRKARFGNILTRVLGVVAFVAALFIAPAFLGAATAAIGGAASMGAAIGVGAIYGVLGYFGVKLGKGIYTSFRDRTQATIDEANKMLIENQKEKGVSKENYKVNESEYESLSSCFSSLERELRQIESIESSAARAEAEAVAAEAVAAEAAAEEAAAPIPEEPVEEIVPEEAAAPIPEEPVEEIVPEEPAASTSEEHTEEVVPEEPAPTVVPLELSGDIGSPEASATETSTSTKKKKTKAEKPKTSTSTKKKKPEEEASEEALEVTNSL